MKLVSGRWIYVIFPRVCYRVSSGGSAVLFNKFMSPPDRKNFGRKRQVNVNIYACLIFYDLADKHIFPSSTRRSLLVLILKFPKLQIPPPTVTWSLWLPYSLEWVFFHRGVQTSACPRRTVVTIHYSRFFALILISTTYAWGSRVTWFPPPPDSPPPPSEHIVEGSQVTRVPNAVKQEGCTQQFFLFFRGPFQCL